MWRKGPRASLQVRSSFKLWVPHVLRTFGETRHLWMPEASAHIQNPAFSIEHPVGSMREPLPSEHREPPGSAPPDSAASPGRRGAHHHLLHEGPSGRHVSVGNTSARGVRRLCASTPLVSGTPLLAHPPTEFCLLCLPPLTHHF